MEFIGAIILAHLVGDYLLQTDWMSKNKTSRWWPAIVHGVVYAIPFLFITQSIPALLVIAGTHVVIDRFRLAKHLVWFKNQFAPKASRYAWKGEDFDPASGYPKSTPDFLAVWLMIIADNTLHLIINLAAVVFLG